MPPRTVALASLALLGCRDTAPEGEPAITLRASPAVVTCAAGERVPLAVHGAAGRAALDFALVGDGVALADVHRTDGTATIVCLAQGRTTLVVSAPNASVGVPVDVRAAPAGAVRIALAPSAVAMNNGTTAWLVGSVTASVPGVTTDVRYRSADSTIVTVDSLSGQLRATGPGSTDVIAEARADRSVQARARVSVVPGGSVVGGVAVLTPTLGLVVGDTGRVQAYVFLRESAPATTSRDVAFASTDSTIARVTRDGLVRAMRAGSATIVASAVAAPLIRAIIGVQVLEPPP